MKDKEAIEAWIVNYLAKRLEVGTEMIDTTLMFDRFGLDSVTATCLVADLGEQVGEELDPSLVYDHPTIDALAGHLAENLRLEQA